MPTVNPPLKGAPVYRFPYPNSPLAYVPPYFPIREVAVAAAHVCHFWSRLK